MKTAIRKASPGDVPAILELIRELAKFEKLEHHLVATTEDLLTGLFGTEPAAHALVAEDEDGVLVGYAVYFSTFSTFVGKAGIWLEDIYVTPEHRGKGLGKRLLRAVAGQARDRDAGRLEWTVLDWNRRALEFYEAAGAEILREWKIARMEGDAIRRLADPP